ncbi:L-lactate dehydrogenase [Rivularia sp. UHCC 0363]|uniref:L-lactate dehydrogenase n=1 Tax=Rivularia sp. UHCC 0363 TaxID=3110244 RepID=UPI002B1ED4A9|nr:L-lactate dehydrogenase [Rivularia sp. UHCC 0363]MEA5597928.1 L-lactate dehydrogenase [Rivularia sp. UHCC 0363]
MQQFFTFPSDATEKTISKLRPRKGVIIGAGQVGLACAYSLLIQNTLDELVLVDINQKKLEGEVMDLLHGSPFLEPTVIKAGSLADGIADNADVVIITAGSKRLTGETRLDLMQRNSELFKNLIPEVVKHCPDAILLIVTNPVDVMTYISLQLSGLPNTSVIGSGTVLDTARFRYLLAEKLQLDSRNLHAYIIGEHGDSEVPVWSKVNISGMHLCEGGLEKSTTAQQEFLDQIFEQVKKAGQEIIKRKGATSYAIGLGVTDIVKAILRDQNRIFTVSSLVEDFYGIKDVCLSLPTVINRRGVDRKLNLTLTETELKQLKKSSEVLHNAISQLKL